MYHAIQRRQICEVYFFEAMAQRSSGTTHLEPPSNLPAVRRQRRYMLVQGIRLHLLSNPVMNTGQGEYPHIGGLNHSANRSKYFHIRLAVCLRVNASVPLQPSATQPATRKPSVAHDL